MYTIFASNALALAVVRVAPRGETAGHAAALVVAHASLSMRVSYLTCAQLSVYTFVTCTTAVYLDYRGWIIKV